MNKLNDRKQLSEYITVCWTLFGQVEAKEETMVVNGEFNPLYGLNRHLIIVYKEKQIKIAADLGLTTREENMIEKEVKKNIHKQYSLLEQEKLEKRIWRILLKK